MRGRGLLYFIAMASTYLAAVLSMLNPIIFKIAVDNVIGDNALESNDIIYGFVDKIGGMEISKNNIWICGVLIVAITAITGIFSFLRGKFAAAASESAAKRLKDNLYDHLQKMPYDYHVKAKTGDLIQRCTSDVETVRKFLAVQLMEVTRTVVIVAFALYVMSGTNIKMTLISIIAVPIIFIFAFFFFRQIKKVFQEADEKEGELSTILQENLSGVRVVRAFGRQRYEMGKYDEKSKEFRDLIQKMLKLIAYYWSFSDMICFFQIGAVILYGINLSYSNEITIGTFMLFNSYIMMLLWPIRELGRILSEMGKMQVSLARIYEVLDTEIEKETDKGEKPSLKGDIVFDNVSFGYEKDKLILKGISFHVKNGETIAVLGPTGSGKSTLMHILLRFYDYSSGSIKINGVELNSIEKKYLREHVGIVLQEPFLFSKTIKENIKMAKYAADDATVFEAAKIASVHDTIEAFERGYKTIVGEKGITLSGGQKQRIAIARVLIKDSSILIFDDSLSAVDTETDANIRSALKDKQKDTTTFIISQRITTLMQADRIFVIEDGKLSDRGSHQELILREGLYSRIWKIQSMPESDFDTDSSLL